jgi:signal transduction histidine kinase
MHKKRKLFVQVGFTIAAFIFAVEGVVLFVSIENRKNELLDLRHRLDVDVMEKANKSYVELHPGILDDADIDKRMNRYSIHTILVTFFISIVVVFGSLFVFYYIAGRHILLLTKLNESRSENNKIPIYPSHRIPNNEIGELIQTRNKMLLDINSYQDELEEKLDEAKDQLLQSAKLTAVGEFTSIIVHDIRNPLQMILSYCEILLASDGVKNAGNKNDEKVKKIMKAASRINDLAARMGEFGRTELAYKDGVSLDKVIDNALLFSKKKINDRSIQVVRFGDSDICCWGDQISLEQVMMNLFSNACDALIDREKKEINISVINKEKNIEIKIVDTGEGIPKEIIEKVFESFFTTKIKGQGTGLGLSGSKKIIDAHQGELKMTSELGVGTSFVIILPKKNPHKEA